MPQKPKTKPKSDKADVDTTDKDNWEEDQKLHGYYYDDAYGYEKFDPEKAEEAEED